ncbi:hypothetical protein D3C86_2097210 [compost metagenome]
MLLLFVVTTISTFLGSVDSGQLRWLQLRHHLDDLAGIVLGAFLVALRKYRLS